MADDVPLPEQDALAPTGEAAPDRVQSTATGELLERLRAAPKLDRQRFELCGEVGRGGMGAVLKVQDRLLNRRLAMKVLLERAEPRNEEERRLHAQLLGRFIEEAQVTSQLDHPGVIPVHELGLDSHGKVYFTMRLVKGRTASDPFADAFHERDGWNLTRALEVVLRVCDAMAYAHDKGVLHRDLKPSNIMVGRFGEVYVMDWGLAKVVGQEDRHDLRIKDPGTGVSRIESARGRDAETDTASSVVTMDGHALGTPSYMPPEQARSEKLDARADVYAIGAMLYEIVTGRAPYTAPGVRVHPYHILTEVVDGPPKRIDDLHGSAPAELVAIVEKAMARAREDRYRSVLELAGDLRAFLAHRVVKAYRTGAVVEMRLWMRRNKALAAAVASVVVALAAGFVTTALQADEARRQETLANYNLRRFEAVRYRALLDEATAAADELRSESPRDLVAMERWLLQYGEPLSIASDAVDAAERFLGGIDPVSTITIGDTTFDEEEWLDRLARARAEGIFQVSIEGPRDPTIPFLQRLVQGVRRDLAVFLEPENGLLARVRGATERAQVLRKLTLAHPNAHVTWPQARAAIARADGVVASALYADQDIPLQDDDIWGLVPIGMNPHTRLWEFYDLRSAWDGRQDPATLPIPRHGADGRLTITGETGIVFVLLPGGTLPPGTPFDSSVDAVDERASASARRRLTLRLDSFFLGKHELTQHQWLRWTGHDPSTRGATGGALPVDNVRWLEVASVLRTHELVLPSELQWEYAIRGGTTTLWWTGDDETGVRTAENLPPTELLPVGSRSPNPFGLFDMGGNVWEWCLDEFGAYGTERAGDGRRPEPRDGSVARVFRGGSIVSEYSSAQSHYRAGAAPADCMPFLGLRPARMARQ